MDTVPSCISLSTPWLLPGRSFGLGADERALEIAGDQPAPGRVLLDIMMPDMDSYAVCRQQFAPVRVETEAARSAKSR